MASSKKRSFEDLLGVSNTRTPTPSFVVPRVAVTTQSWQSLSSTVANNRATVLDHKYKVAATGKSGVVSLSHTHGEFNKKISGGLTIDSHNISTSDLGRAPRSFPKILDDLTTVAGARDTLRVLKGTHLTKGLTGASATSRKAATELGAEIGVSEYSRGTNVALTDAAINLYRVKHGELAKDDFADHAKGYSGAGKGGAKRLRSIDNVSDTFAPYEDSLRAIYDSHASQKASRPWEKSIRKSATSQEKFDSWRAHKATKWTQRE